MIICKWPDPPDDHLQEAGSSGWSIARGRILQTIIWNNDNDNDNEYVQIITSSGVPVPMEGIWAYLGFTASVYFDQWLFSTDSLGWTIAFLLYYPWPKDAARKGCVICNLVLVLRRTSWRPCSVHRPSVAQLTSPSSSIGFATATPLTIIPQTFDFPTRSTWPTWRPVNWVELVNLFCSALFLEHLALFLL